MKIFVSRIVNWTVNSIHHHAGIILLFIMFTTALMVPGLQRITIVQEAAETYFTTQNELIQSVLHIKQSFNADTRQSVISLETQKNLKVLDPHILELIQNLSEKIKSIPSIQTEKVLSLTTITQFQNTTDGLSSERLFKDIPASKIEVNKLKKTIRSNEFIYGRLVSKDFKSTLIIAPLKENADLALVHRELQNALSSFQNQIPGVSINLVGEPEINYQLHASTERDILIFIFVSIALILLSFYIIFRSWHGVVLPLVAILVGIIWTMGLIGYYGEPITLISATLPVVLVVIGSACSIHIFHFLQKEKRRGIPFQRAFRVALQKFISPLAMSTLTTFIGGITLLAFKIKPIQQFGFFTAVGTLIMSIVALIVIPCFFKLLQKPFLKIENTFSKGIKNATSIATTSFHHVPIAGTMTEALAESVSGSIKGGMQGFCRGAQISTLFYKSLKGISRLVNKHPFIVLSTTVLMCIVSAFYSTKLEIGFDNISLLPNQHPVKTATQRIDQTYGGIQTLDLLIDTNKVDGLLDPNTLSKIQTFQSEALKLPQITYAFSMADILHKMHSTLNPSDLRPLPNSKEAISQYLFLLSISGGQISPQSLITSDNQKLKISLTTSAHDTKEFEKLCANIYQLAKEKLDGIASIEIGGSPVVAIALMRYILLGKVENILISLFLILGLLMFIHRSTTRGILTVLSLPIGILLNFGLMGYFNIRLDFITAIITSFAMGIGVEFSIHFITHLKEQYSKVNNLDLAIEKTILGPGKTIVYNAFTNIIGFSALLFSKFSAIHTFALLMNFSMTVLVLSSLIVLPSVIKIIQPEFITEYRRKNRISERRLSFAMKITLSSLVFAILTLGIVLIDLHAEEKVSAQELAKKSLQSIYTDNEESVYTMKLIDSSGNITTRKMKIWFRSPSQNSAKLLIKFSEPADIRGTGFLTIIDNGKATDQWLYLPALRKARRIKGGNANESFLGSDFTMGDLSLDGEDEMTYEVTGSKRCGDDECFIVTGSAKPGSNNPYTKKIMYIRKDNYISTSIELYNHSNQIEKVLTVHGIHKENGKTWIADKIEVKNLIKNHRTVLEVEERNRSKEVPNHIFTQSSLERL